MEWSAARERVSFLDFRPGNGKVSLEARAMFLFMPTPIASDVVSNYGVAYES